MRKLLINVLGFAVAVCVGWFGRGIYDANVNEDWEVNPVAETSYIQYVSNDVASCKNVNATFNVEGYSTKFVNISVDPTVLPTDILSTRTDIVTFNNHASPSDYPAYTMMYDHNRFAFDALLTHSVELYMSMADHVSYCVDNFGLYPVQLRFFH